MSESRTSGILLHPTSLPGPFGIGDLGPGAHDFVRLLREAGQSVWQMLPLCPTGYGDSPYQGLSAFAGNPLLLSADRLFEEGLLETNPSEPGPDTGAGEPDRVDYGAVIAAKKIVLAEAWGAFEAGRASEELGSAFDDFKKEEAEWLDEWTLFASLHDHHRCSWVDWPTSLARRDEKALAEARDVHRADLNRHAFAQFLFFRQWEALRSCAKDAGVQLMGDLPLFVAHDSVDVWAHRELFDLDDDGQLNRVSGAPPDAFTSDGQLWGTPLYRWDALREADFDWWIRRVRANRRLFDRIRLDHFRGFVGCWAVDASEDTARNGNWETVPGRELFDAIREKLGDVEFVAEDLGEITDEVTQLREDLGFPGMRVLQFAFQGDANENPHSPFRTDPNAVIYTGTHDNETSLGWFRADPSADTPDRDAERARAAACIGSDIAEPHWGLIRLAWLSGARVAITPAQDLLGLGNETRMNFPGTSQSNWQWRILRDQWTDQTTDRLRLLTEASGR